MTLIFYVRRCRTADPLESYMIQWLAYRGTSTAILVEIDYSWQVYLVTPRRASYHLLFIFNGLAGDSSGKP